MADTMEATGAAMITGETVWIVMIDDKFGPEAHAFSTEAAADLFAWRHARRIWAKYCPEDEMPSSDGPDFWQQFFDNVDDVTIEVNRCLVDEEG